MALSKTKVIFPINKSINICRNLPVSKAHFLGYTYIEWIENMALTKFEKTSIVSFETIETVEKLTHLIEALK